MKISEFLGQVIGERGKTDMNEKTIYTDAPNDVSKAIAEGETVTDFLPPPEQLSRREAKTKITITLNTQSVNFFKQYAEKHHTKYQTMINEVLDKYVQKYKDKLKA
jgi:predicted DNA binding CopG/RHH family protein